MLPALSTAANGMLAQSQKLESAAASIASLGATAPQPASSGSGASSPVRIGALPVGDPLESVVTMKEAELAYKLNAAVFATADEMMQTLLDVMDPKTRT